MTKATEFLRYLGASVLLWIVFLRQDFDRYIWLPFIFIILFGVYALTNIGFHLYRFQECPKAYQELLKDMSRAKTDLKRRGIIS